MALAVNRLAYYAIYLQNVVVVVANAQRMIVMVSCVVKRRVIMTVSDGTLGCILSQHTI